jgi:hypothetical protein
MPTNIPTGKFRVQNKVGEEAKVIGDFGTPEEAFSQAQAQNSVLGVEEGSLSPLFVFNSAGELVYGPANY